MEVPVSELITIFNRVPILAGYRPSDFQLKILPGYTNLNIHLKNDQHDWVLRVPKAATNQTIDRNQEAYNASLAYGLGIAPECIWRDESGFSLTRTLLNSRPITTRELDNQTVNNSLMATISRLHKSNNKFQGRVDLRELIEYYYRLTSHERRKQIESDYRVALNKVDLLSSLKIPLVPSHNDLVLENILIDEAGTIHLIDWEYASMATPYWDLATLCNVAKFNRKQSKQLLDKYRIENASLELEILAQYRFLLKVLTTCWMAAYTRVDLENVIADLGS